MNKRKLRNIAKEEQERKEKESDEIAAERAKALTDRLANHGPQVTSPRDEIEPGEIGQNTETNR